jgi:hypothetical protein
MITIILIFGLIKLMPFPFSLSLSLSSSLFSLAHLFSHSLHRFNGCSNVKLITLVVARRCLVCGSLIKHQNQSAKQINLITITFAIRLQSPRPIDSCIKSCERSKSQSLFEIHHRPTRFGAKYHIFRIVRRSTICKLIDWLSSLLQSTSFRLRLKTAKDGSRNGVRR